MNFIIRGEWHLMHRIFINPNMSISKVVAVGGVKLR